MPGEENLGSRLRRPEGKAGWHGEKVVGPGVHQRGVHQITVTLAKFGTPIRVHIIIFLARATGSALHGKVSLPPLFLPLSLPLSLPLPLSLSLSLSLSISSISSSLLSCSEPPWCFSWNDILERTERKCYTNRTIICLKQVKTYMQIYLVALVIRKMKIKTVVRFHSTPSKMIISSEAKRIGDDS